MPSLQRGAVLKKNGRWAVRYYDEDGRRQFHTGFETKSAARGWVDHKCDEIEALRRGDPAALRRREMPTLQQLADEFIGQHNAEPATLPALADRLKYATKGPALDGQGGFADIRIDRLQMHEIAAWRKRLPPAPRGRSTRRSGKSSPTP